MKIAQDDKEVIWFTLIWLILFIPAFVLWYDFRNFTICFFETFNVELFDREYQNCNIEDANKILEWLNAL